MTTDIDIEARETDRGPFEVLAFDGKAVRVLHERHDRTEPDELDQHLCTGCIAKHKNRQDADLDEMLDDIETEVVE